MKPARRINVWSKAIVIVISVALTTVAAIHAVAADKVTKKVPKAAPTPSQYMFCNTVAGPLKGLIYIRERQSGCNTNTEKEVDPVATGLQGPMGPVGSPGPIGSPGAPRQSCEIKTGQSQQKGKDVCGVGPLCVATWDISASKPIDCDTTPTDKGDAICCK